MTLFELFVSGQQLRVAMVRGVEASVGHGAQVVLDLEHLARGEAPVVVAQVVEVCEAVAFQPASQIDKRIEVTPRQIA